MPWTFEIFFEPLRSFMNLLEISWSPPNFSKVTCTSRELSELKVFFLEVTWAFWKFPELLLNYIIFFENTMNFCALPWTFETSISFFEVPNFLRVSWVFRKRPGYLGSLPNFFGNSLNLSVVFQISRELPKYVRSSLNLL